jgi:2-keto-3-deoxy-L-rhamnonate aldolase RhmA
MKTSFKARLNANEPMMGTLAFLPSADIVELLAVAGFNFVIIDLEHSPTTMETALHMVRAAQLHGMAPLIRVRENSDKLILQALEIGAEGIVVPFVQSAADVERAAKAIRYAPGGVRGTCTASRPSRYGTLRANFAEHARRTNDEIALVALIEDAAGVDAIEEIVACEPGLDAVLVGRSDLSASLGRMGQASHPDVVNATNRIIKAANGSSRAVQAGIVFTAPEETSKWMDAGCRFITYGTDIDLFVGSATRAREAFSTACSSSPRKNARVGTL